MSLTTEREIKEDEDAFEVDVYPRRDIVLVRGEGTRLFDINGNSYLDFASNVGVSTIGHANQQVADAIHGQYLKLGNCYSIFYNEVRAKLARRLSGLAPGSLSKVFFCNSGTEAVEAAIKFARASTGRKEIVCAMRGYHGKTMGALSATWGQEIREPFAPLVEGFVHVPYNNTQRMREVHSDKTAAVLLEVVQGEGGVRIGDKQYFEEVKAQCEKCNSLLIIDEVQTGFGRTGTMFACEQYVEPDILCLAKSIAGGIPMGAIVCNEKVCVPKKSHTSTFGGSPLACAASFAAIDFMEQNNLVNNARELGDYFMQRLKSINSQRIREVRGLGLMIGVELKDKAGPYVQALMEKRIIVLLAGNYVIRMLPPLIITKEEIDIAVKALEEVLA